MNFEFIATYGGFINGTNLKMAGQLNIRFQPIATVAMRFDYNKLKLADEYGN